MNEKTILAGEGSFLMLIVGLGRWIVIFTIGEMGEYRTDGVWVKLVDNMPIHNNQLKGNGFAPFYTGYW